MKRALIALAIVACAPAVAQDAQKAKAGGALYARHCAPCHGTRMANPEGAADLRKFPRDDRERFVATVTRGKNQMPPWGDLLKPDEIDSLWAYVSAGGG